MVVRLDVLSSGSMSRGLTMVDDVEFEVRKEAIEVKNDAEFVPVFLKLFKRLVCCCALNSVLMAVIAQSQRFAVSSQFACRMSAYRMCAQACLRDVPN